MVRIRRFARGWMAIALLVAGLGWAPAAGAATGQEPAAPAVTFTVNSANDGPADFASDPLHNICRTDVNNNTCTLRAAVMNANRLPGGAIIHLPAGNYFITIPVVSPDDDATGNLNITTTVTLVGAGAASTIIDGGLVDNIFNIEPHAAMTISGVTIQHGNKNNAFGNLGGGIANLGRLSLADSALIDNQAAGAGGLANASTATLDRVTVEANLAISSNAGGIANFGVLTMTNSTVDGNRSVQGGGGLLNSASATLIVFNSTISDNGSQQSGGGVYNSGSASFLASTIAGNLADNIAQGGQRGGGIYNAAAADHLQIANTLLADNAVSITERECGGPITSQDYNLIETTNDCNVGGTTTHNIINLINFPLVGTLADNGGPTRTRGLRPGNLGLDQIPPAQCHDLFGTAPAPDQRGVARPVGPKCDIGAFEGMLPVIPYFHNLVENGDGEGSAGSPTGARVFSADWLTFPQFTVVSYGAVGGFPGVLSPTVPINHGANFFAGGKAALSFTYRYIELPPISSSIDAGAVKYVLSADLGGFQSQDDNAKVLAGFYDENFVTVGITATIGPVMAADRADETGFRHVASAPAVVPLHARWVYVEIDLTRVSLAGPYNDGYADNVSFVLLPRAALYLPLVRR